MASIVLHPYPAIDDLLEPPIPETLWHYTSLEGLLGIIESRSIWASDMRYLNDTAEFKHGVSLLERQVVALAADANDPLEINKLIVAMLQDEDGSSTYLSTLKNNDFYVASFSRHGDQLSQWRGYTPAGRGVSLGFNLAGLRPPKESELLMSFAPCIYSIEDQTRIFLNAFATFNHGVLDCQTILNDHMRSKVFPRQPNEAEEVAKVIKAVALGLKASLLRVIPHLKDPSFKEEAEWRFFASIITESKPVHIRRFMRVKDHKLVPTIVLPFSNFVQTFPLQHIIVGPSPEPESLVQGVETLLRWNELTNVKVSKSLIPFRSW